MFIPDYFLNTDPTAQNGPPVVVRNGIVLGGNSRAMTMRLVYSRNPQAAERYRQALADTASHYGIEAEKLQGMREPVLVRVLDNDIPATDLARKSREYNQVSTQKLQIEAEAISRGKLASQEAIGALAEGIEEYGDLSRLLSGTRGLRLVELLARDSVIQQTELSSLTNRSGFLNVQGRGLVTSILRGIAAPDYDTVAYLPADIGNKLDGIIASVARAKVAGAEWDISPTLVGALKLVNEASFKGIPVSQHLSQGMLVSSVEASPAEKVLALTLEKATREEEVAGRFELFAADARRGNAGTGLLGASASVDPSYAFKKAFLEDAAAVGKKPLAAFNPDGNPLHKAIAWGIDNAGGKSATVKKALEKAAKKLQKAKTQEDKEILATVQQEFAALNGRLSRWPARAGKFLGIDENAPLELTAAKTEAASPDTPVEIPVEAPAENKIARGSVAFTNGSEALVTLFRSADLSTVPHELSHITRRQLEIAATSPNASPSLKRQWRDVCNFVGAKAGEKWTGAMEEKFARAMERFLFEGVAPNARLIVPFEMMKEDLRKIYADADAAGLQISPEMREIFNEIYSLPVNRADAQYRQAVADLHARRWEEEFAPAPELDGAWRENYEQGNLEELQNILQQERQILDEDIAMLESGASPEMRELLQGAKEELAKLDEAADLHLNMGKLLRDYARCLIGA